MNRFTVLFAILGMLSITWGAAWMYRPFGPLVCGFLLLSAAFLSARKK